MTTGGPLLPKDLTNPQRVEPMAPLIGGESPREAGTFQTLLQKQATAQLPPKQGQVTSPFELAKAGAPQLAAGPNMSTISQQVLHAQTTVGDINNMLATQNLKVKASSKYLLRNKLSEANQHLRTVNSKVGGQQGEEGEEGDMPAGSGPLKKFLGFVMGSQTALNSTQKQLEELSSKGESLNPAEMLFVQVKLSRAQQLLDYSSILLAKAIEDMKSLFSVQL